MSYSLGNVKPWVAQAANDIGPKFGIRTVYGYSYRNVAGTTTLSDHALGLALDFMCDIPTGDKLASYVQSNAGAYSVTYIIHNRKIWSVARAREGWRAYTGVNPHTDHVHVSFNSRTTGSASNATNANYLPLPIIPHLGKGGGPGLPIGPGGANPSGNTIEQVYNSLTSIAKIATFFANPNNWIRATMFAAGIVLLALAIRMLLASESAAQAATSTAKTATKTITKVAQNAG